MALKFYRKRDIDLMDVNDIPEDFINYFETLDDNSKASLIGARPDLAEALEFVLPSGGDEVVIDELGQISKNIYSGINLDDVLKDNMSEIEALAISDGTTICPLHREPLEKKQIAFRDPKTKGIFGIILKICRKCHRVYLEEPKMSWIHKELIKRDIPHTFYSLQLTNQYLQSQKLPYEFSSNDILYIPDLWVEEDPRCPIHEDTLYDVTCLKKYKNREVSFKCYKCDRCNKYLIRRASALDLMDRCAEKGIPQIETEKLTIKELPKKVILPQKVKSDYMIENGKRTKFHYNVTSGCYQLSETDIVVVSDSIYCTIYGHDLVEEVVALIRVFQKSGERKNYLFHLGYCTDCQKYYMDQDDYKVLYSIGRPEVTILHDFDDTDYSITSGEVFNLERKHLQKIEKGISKEIKAIESKPDYVNPYATGDYDDGNLAYAKYVSRNKYDEQLRKLSKYKPRPYSYRVDISSDSTTETYYIGANNIDLGGNRQVISVNSKFGRNLTNYQTINIIKDDKKYGIRLSRQFDIKNAHLYGYTNLRTDEDMIFKSGVTDPFLIRVLNMRKRQHNLTDIFVTIQENQNRIVDAPFTKNIIVQGCAGSGKSMVLLHRLSSLNYEEKNFSFSEKALILTPNDHFNLHIKGLAEELQIGSIRRVSVEQYYLEMLNLYSSEFKSNTKVSSEMNVKQNYVDYIYSDQFRKDFQDAYTFVIGKRNKLTVVLDNLLKVMDQPMRTIDLSDDSKVIQQIKLTVDAMNSLVQQRELEVESAINDYEKHIARKKFLQERLQSAGERYSNIVEECLPRVYTKIGTYLSERQYRISGLNEQIENLKTERNNIQNNKEYFGKEERLKELDEQIKKAERRLNIENRNHDKELPILRKTIRDNSDRKVLTWMSHVMQIIPEVKDELTLCNNLREENRKFYEELNGIDDIIIQTKNDVDAKKASIYPNKIKKRISILNSKIDSYSMLGTFQMVFDRAVHSYKEKNNIKIKGKNHRYDLYARLLFAMKYFGTALGTVQFICVDEGQDLAFNEYRLLYELNQYNIVFNIFGDTNQLMKTNRGISDWSKLKNTFNADIYELNENYRNTNQITRFCNSSFDMKVTQTGVDGAKVREISRKELEAELSELNITLERIAILIPRSISKKGYLKQELMPSSINSIIGEKIDNGYIAIMYVDEVKGIEFDKAFVVSSKMSRNEKYIAYTRALSELILVIDENVS